MMSRSDSPRLRRGRSDQFADRTMGFVDVEQRLRCTCFVPQLKFSAPLLRSVRPRESDSVCAAKRSLNNAPAVNA